MPYANKDDKTYNRRLTRNDRFNLRKRVGENIRIWTRGDRFWEEGIVVEVTPDYVELKQQIVKYEHDGLQVCLNDISKVMLHPKHQPKEQLTKAQQKMLEDNKKYGGD